ncbi:MAG: hypothetical protein JSS02_23720 [Planctomycetes bacterium]|nr:hypothetical protein [Planctomycetota bacterium]
MIDWLGTSGQHVPHVLLCEARLRTEETLTASQLQALARAFAALQRPVEAARAESPLQGLPAK